MHKWFNTYVIRIPEEENRKCSRSNISNTSDWEFSKTDDRNPSTDSKSKGKLGRINRKKNHT